METPSTQLHLSYCADRTFPRVPGFKRAGVSRARTNENEVVQLALRFTQLATRDTQIDVSAGVEARVDLMHKMGVTLRLISGPSRTVTGDLAWIIERARRSVGIASGAEHSDDLGGIETNHRGA